MIASTWTTPITTFMICTCMPTMDLSLMARLMMLLILESWTPSWKERKTTSRNIPASSTTPTSSRTRATPRSKWPRTLSKVNTDELCRHSELRSCCAVTKLLGHRRTSLILICSANLFKQRCISTALPLSTRLFKICLL